MTYRSGLLVSFLFAAALHAQPPLDQQATQHWLAAQQTLAQKQYGPAAAKFREYLQKYPRGKETFSVKLALADLLIEGPEKNLKEAGELLKAFPAEDPVLGFRAYYALYRIERLQLVAELAAGQNPKARFESADKHLQAAAIFLQRTEPDQLANLDDLKVRVLCDDAELLLRQDKAQLTLDALEPLLKRLNAASKYRPLALYYAGDAYLRVGNVAAAQRALTGLTPYNQPGFGPHARYLLARTHHLSDERPEALLHYEGSLRDFQSQKLAAVNQLKQPQLFQNDPVIRLQLENVVKSPTPAYLTRAAFQLGLLLFEANRIGEAKQRFADVAKLDVPERDEAELRVGICMVHLKEFPEAIKTLTALLPREAKLGEGVSYWLGKAYFGSAPAGKTAPEQQAVLQQALKHLDAARTLVKNDKLRTDEITLEIADVVLQQARYPELATISAEAAAKLYQQLLTAGNLGERTEEVGPRLVQALALAGKLDESDAAAQRFQERYPRSLYLGDVLFTYAENAYVRAAKDPKGHADEASKRLRTLIQRFTEHPKLAVARYSLGLTLYHQGKLEEAQKVLADLPLAERIGDLSNASHILADCILRLTPDAIADDALAAGKLEEQLKSASELLEGFVAGNGKNPDTYEALAKYGLCQQRMAGLLAQPPAKQKALASARAAYERILKETPIEFPLRPVAMLERGKVLQLQGDVNQAMAEFSKFTQEPFVNSPSAPLATILFATTLRAQNRAKEAAEVLLKARARIEPKLPADDKLVALLRLNHGLALREAGNPSAALFLFDNVRKLWPKLPEALEATLRAGQCSRDEANQFFEQAQKLAGSSKKDDQEHARAAIFLGERKITEANDFLIKSATASEDGNPDLRARMMYEAAWGARQLLERELRQVQSQASLEAKKALGPIGAKFGPPEVPLDRLPELPSEKRVAEIYGKLIDAFGDTLIAVDARYELAELLAQRRNWDAVQPLLADILDKEPGPDMTEKVRLRLGNLHAQKGNFKGAAAQFEAILRNPKSPHLAWAQYGLGEVHMSKKEYAEALKRFTLFREQDVYKTVPNLSDRAVLRGGQALLEMGRLEESKGMFDRVLTKYPGSPWVDEARYGQAWILQQQKNYDPAIALYQQVTARTPTEIAAKAQYQIGKCRQEQKKAPEAVAAYVLTTQYNVPDLAATALWDASQIHAQLGQREPMEMLLRKLLADYPDSARAKEAKQRLDKQ